MLIRKKVVDHGILESFSDATIGVDAAHASATLIDVVSRRDGALVSEYPESDVDDVFHLCYLYSMATMTINGVSVTGNNISVINGVIYVDGHKVDVKGTGSRGDIAEVHILSGLVENISCDGSVTAQDVGGKISAGGSVNCGSVEGNVSAGGSVNCGAVGGKVNAGGSVRHG